MVRKNEDKPEEEMKNTTEEETEEKNTFGEEEESFKEMTEETMDDDERMIMAALERKGKYKLMKQEMSPEEGAEEDSESGISDPNATPTDTTTTQGHQEGVPNTGADIGTEPRQEMSPNLKGINPTLLKSPLGQELVKMSKELETIRKGFDRAVEKKVNKILENRKSFLKAISEDTAAKTASVPQEKGLFEKIKYASI